MSKKLLKINANEIKRASFVVDNSLARYIGHNTITETFEKYNIPLKYQIMFFYKNNANDTINERITDTTFHLTETERGYLKAVRIKNSPLDKTTFNTYLIETSEVNCSEKEIMDFYMNLCEEGFLEDYMRIISEYFVLNMDVEMITKLPEDDHKLNSHQKIKLYKKRILENKNKK